MENRGSSTASKNLFTILVIAGALIISFAIFYTIFRSPVHFNQKGDPQDFFGMIYKGGPIVPILMSFALIVIIFSIERSIVILSAKGKGSMTDFVKRIKIKLAQNDIEGAINECERQRGSIGNVVYEALIKYKSLSTDTSFDKEQKLKLLEKEIEEATTLEMPMLEKNLTILATLASISTLVGLLGTVIGMIKAFAALSEQGNPDNSALANGISEALINTAIGIGTSALAIVMYNLFTSKIDELNHNIDEAGFTIQQNFTANVR